MGDQRFIAAAAEVCNIHRRKRLDYGTDSDAFANVRASAAFGVEPWLGAVVRANDKMVRLQQYAVRGTLANEGVEDTLLDLASYALIALVLWREVSAESSGSAYKGAA